MNMSPSIAHLAKALSLLQSEIKDAEKDTQGYGYKYADLYQVLSLIRPLLLKHGLSFSQHVGNLNDQVTIETILMHESGEWISSELGIPPTSGKNMSAAQAVGSAITYGRRYALTAIFGITQTNEDIDGANVQEKPVANPASSVVKGVNFQPKGAASFNPLVAKLQQAHADGDMLTALELWDSLTKVDKKASWGGLSPDAQEWIKELATSVKDK